MGGLFQWESFSNILNKDFRSWPLGCKARSRLVLSACMLAQGLRDTMPWFLSHKVGASLGPVFFLQSTAK